MVPETAPLCRFGMSKDWVIAFDAWAQREPALQAASADGRPIAKSHGGGSVTMGIGCHS